MSCSTFQILCAVSCYVQRWLRSVDARGPESLELDIILLSMWEGLG